MSETATVEQLQTEQPAVQTPEPAPAAPETQSIRQHAEKYGHDKTPRPGVERRDTGVADGDGSASTDSAVPAAGERARDESGRFAKADATPKPEEGKRHRAKDIATPEDVPRIRELTAKWREEQRQRAALEAELAQYRAQVAQPQPQPGQPVPLQHAIARPDVSRPALTDAEFYQQYPDASVGDFVDYRTAYRIAAQSAVQQQQASQTEIDQFVTKTQADHQSRIQEFAKSHPEYDQAVEQAADVPTTPVVNWAVALHPRSPEVVLYLARHPEVAYDLALKTRSLTVDDDAVAWTQRLFDRWLQPAPTASGAPARHPIAPPPPNAVRTGPIKTGDEPPADGAGIRAHAQYFGYDKKRR